MTLLLKYAMYFTDVYACIHTSDVVIEGIESTVLYVEADSYQWRDQPKPGKQSTCELHGVKVIR